VTDGISSASSRLPGSEAAPWEEIDRSLYEAMKTLPRERLQFLAFPASDAIIRQAAANVLTWLDNRDRLPRVWVVLRLADGSDFDVPVDDGDASSALEQAATVAKRNHQIVIWGRAERPCAIAVCNIRTKQLHPLDDGTATVLNRDPLIRREWRRWNAMTRNQGSLIVLDTERVVRILAAATDEPDEDTR
jgi:hypothetical protein